MLTLNPASLLSLLNIVLLLGVVSAENDGKKWDKGDGHHADKHHNGKRPSIIALIPDGFGPAIGTMSRDFHRLLNPENRVNKFAFDDHHVGSLQTKSYAQLVTDSAAGGTALACGLSTANGFIGFDPDLQPAANVIEGAKAQGYLTGVLTSTRVTHATPASFSSHAYDRNDEEHIAVQQLGGYTLGRQVDLLWGGGKRFFLPQSHENSTRTDDRDLISEAEEAGYTVLLNLDDFKEYTTHSSARRSRISSRNNGLQLPSLGLFTNDHLSFEIDRDSSVEPSLSELSIAALDTLDGGDEPFIIMIEAGRIDHGAHGNDPVATIHDSIEYHEIWRKVIEWVDARSDSGDYRVIAAADHDTGGVSLDYENDWYPTGLLNISNSAEYLTAWLETETEGMSEDDVRSLVIDEVLGQRLGMDNLTGIDVDLLVNNVLNGSEVDTVLIEIYNNASGLWWGTGGHHAVDINLYLYPQHGEGVLESIVGNHPNPFFAQWIANYIGLDLAPITATLLEDDSLRNETRREDILASIEYEY